MNEERGAGSRSGGLWRKSIFTRLTTESEPVASEITVRLPKN